MELKKSDMEYEIFQDNIIQKVKQYIKDNDMTITKFGKSCGLMQSTMSKLLKKQTTMTISHIYQFAKVMGCDPGVLLIQSPKLYNQVKNLEKDETASQSKTITLDASSDGFVASCDRYSFKGIMGQYYFYSNPTISSEFDILKGTLSLEKADINDKTCYTKLVINTGNIDKYGNAITKTYEGQTINSLPMQCTFSTLISNDTADFVFLNWHHFFLTSAQLQCRMVACITASSGSDRRPVMLKAIISRTPLDDDDLKELSGDLKMNNERIYVREDDLNQLQKNIGTDKSSVISPETYSILEKEVFSEKPAYKIYEISEDRINSLVNMKKEEKQRLIRVLRRISTNPRYVKISTKTDSRLYEYIVDKQREQNKQAGELPEDQ